MKSEHWERPLRARLHVLLRFAYDFFRYTRHSSSVRAPRSAAGRQASIVKLAHVVEKGLALPEPRLNFGEGRIRDLCDALLREPDTGSMAFSMGVNALRSYVAFHTAQDVSPAAFVQEALQRLEERQAVDLVSSTRQVSIDELRTAIGEGPEEFLSSRRSVRQFSARDVDPQKLVRAAEIASSSPSVCNRQSGRIYIITNRQRIQEALRFQSGNRGFGHSLGALAVVTNELASFLEPNERNQPFVDGGLFSMMFLLGLHAQMLGACPLNWSRNPKTDLDFRKCFDIPDNEEIIMMIGIGELRDSFQVARSPRFAVSEIIKFLE